MPCHVGAHFLYITLNEADKIQKTLTESLMLLSELVDAFLHTLVIPLFPLKLIVWYFLHFFLHAMSIILTF